MANFAAPLAAMPKMSRWMAFWGMCLLMRPVSLTEAAELAAAAMCIFLGKWLDVKSIRRRGLVIDSLRKSGAALLPNSHISAFILQRTLSSVFIEAKAVLFSAVTNRAVQSVSSQVLYLAICTAHVRETRATEMNRIVERGGRKIAGVLKNVLAVAVPSMLRLVLVFREVYVVFGLGHFASLLAATTTYVVYTFAMFRVRARYRGMINCTDNAASRRIKESISNVDLVKICCNEYVEVGSFLEEMRKMCALRVRDAACVGFTNFGQRALFTMLFAHVAFMGVSDFGAGRCTIGELGVLFSLILSIDTSMRTLGTVAKDLGSSLVDCTELLSLHDELMEAVDGLGTDLSQIDNNLETMRRRYKEVDLRGIRTPHSLSRSECSEVRDAEGPAIEFDGVSFMYSSTPILKNMSFRIDCGERVAIVGDNGCGKSTILKLILMFHEYTGEIRIHGRDAREIPVNELRRLIGCILQDMPLFDETIAYNVLYGMPEAGQQDVLEACRKAGLDKVTGKKGLHSRVGDGGRLLSGGEAQMISLARCMLRNTDILLLDEVTAKLDTRLEREIFELIMAIRNKTVVMVLHSMWMTEYMDRIVFVENGAVREMGTHTELMELQGRYWEVKVLSADPDA